MQIRQRDQEKADQIIKSEILSEGEALEKILAEEEKLRSKKQAGEEVPWEAADFDVEAEFQQILAKRQALEEEKQSSQKTSAKIRRISRLPIAKVAIVGITVAVCLLAFSTTSIGRRLWKLTANPREVKTETGTIVNSDENRLHSDFTEQEAAETIEAETGIAVPEFAEFPDGFGYDRFECRDMIQQAYMYYTFDEYVVTLSMQKADYDATVDGNYDGEIVQEKEVGIPYGTVRISEVYAAEDERSMTVALWIYKNTQYKLTGKLDFEIVEQLVNNMIY